MHLWVELFHIEKEQVLLSLGCLPNAKSLSLLNRDLCPVCPETEISDLAFDRYSGLVQGATSPSGSDSTVVGSSPPLQLAVKDDLGI